MKNIWIIQAMTNLQVGSENTSNVGLIDKMIQRDVLTGIPCINASSLKGAMNEYATYVLNMSSNDRKAIFGVDKKNLNDTIKGKCIFFDAHLLLLPVQDAKDELYRLVTSKEQIENFLSLADTVGVKFKYEDFLETLCRLDRHFKKNIVPHSEFKHRCEDDELPIIARNCLDGNGNLWYEQVLPQKSVLGTLIVSDNGRNDAGVTDLDNAVSNFDEKIIQVGANATIGYGFCKFSKLKEG